MTDREDQEILEELRRLWRELEEQTQRQPPEVQKQMRRQGFELYLSQVPWAIRVVAGTERSTIVDSVGNVVEVVPSYCLRLAALDMLARDGLGTDDPLRERETLRSLALALAEEVRRDLALTLDETWAQCPGDYHQGWSWQEPS